MICRNYKMTIKGNYNKYYTNYAGDIFVFNINTQTNKYALQSCIIYKSTKQQLKNRISKLEIWKSTQEISNTTKQKKPKPK